MPAQMLTERGENIAGDDFVLLTRSAHCIDRPANVFMADRTERLVFEIFLRAGPRRLAQGDSHASERTNRVSACQIADDRQSVEVFVRARYRSGTSRGSGI